MFFHVVYKSGQIFLPFCHNSRVWQTDRRTDRRTDRNLIARPRLHSMQRGKKLILWPLWSDYFLPRCTRSRESCPSLRPFLHLSNACIVTKRKKLLSIFFY